MANGGYPLPHSIIWTAIGQIRKLMGTTLFIQIRLRSRALIYFCAVTMILWQPALASPAITITPTLTFTPGGGFLIGYDKERLYFEFQRIAPCPPNDAGVYEDALCQIYRRDIYRIDPFSNSVGLINSEALKKEDFLPSGLSTEDKHLDIIKDVKTADKDMPYESINLAQDLRLNISYHGTAPDIRTLIEFTTTDGEVLFKDEFGLISVHNTLLMTEGEGIGKHSVMLELRWCGTSSCQGQLRFYNLDRSNKNTGP